MNLLDSELRRFFARGVIRSVILAALAVVTLVNVLQLVRATTGTVDQGYVYGRVISDDCVIARDPQGVDVDGNCGLSWDEAAPDGTNQIRFISVNDTRPRVGQTFEGTIRGIGIGGIFLAFIVAASFLAPEFGAAGFSTLLTFEPRRSRVYGTKLTAAAIGCAAILVIVLLYAFAAQWGISVARGSTAGITATWVMRRAGDIGRVGLVTACAAVMSVAITFVTRRTVAAVGILFGSFIAGNFVGAAAWGEKVLRYSPLNSLIAAAANDFSGTDAAFVQSLPAALATFAAWTIAITVACGAWFRRSEIR